MSTHCPQCGACSWAPIPQTHGFTHAVTVLEGRESLYVMHVHSCMRRALKLGKYMRHKPVAGCGSLVMCLLTVLSVELAPGHPPLRCWHVLLWQGAGQPPVITLGVDHHHRLVLWGGHGNITSTHRELYNKLL